MRMCGEDSNSCLPCSNSRVLSTNPLISRDGLTFSVEPDNSPISGTVKFKFTSCECHVLAAGSQGATKSYHRLPASPQQWAEDMGKNTLVLQFGACKKLIFVYVTLTKAIPLVTPKLEECERFNFSISLEKQSCKYLLNSIDDCSTMLCPNALRNLVLLVP